VGDSGGASFNPGPGSVFFVVVANNGSVEGSYGKDSSGITERPEASGLPGCDYTQDLSNSCD
jgi:hypothetical protein